MMKTNPSRYRVPEMPMQTLKTISIERLSYKGLEFEDRAPLKGVCCETCAYEDGLAVK